MPPTRIHRPQRRPLTFGTRPSGGTSTPGCQLGGGGQKGGLSLLTVSLSDVSSLCQSVPAVSGGRSRSRHTRRHPATPTASNGRPKSTQQTPKTTRLSPNNASDPPAKNATPTP